MKAEQNSDCQRLCSLLSSRFILRKSSKYCRKVWEMCNLARKKRINKVKAADKEGAEKAAKTVKDISTNLTLGTEIIGKVPGGKTQTAKGSG